MNARSLAHVYAAHSAVMAAAPHRQFRQTRIQSLREEIGALEAEIAAIDRQAADNLTAELTRAKFAGKDGDVVPALVKPPTPDLMILAIDGDRLLVRREEPNTNKHDTGAFRTHIFGPPEGTNDRRQCEDCGQSINFPSVNVAPLASPEDLEAAEELMAGE